MKTVIVAALLSSIKGSHRLFAQHTARPAACSYRTSYMSAKHYAEAMRLGLRSGQPSEKRIALTMSRDILEISNADPGHLTKALLTDVPDLLAAGQAELARQKNAAADPAEPQASFGLQRSTSQERLSGRPVTDV
jgi:hypothetical protein